MQAWSHPYPRARITSWPTWAACREKRLPKKRGTCCVRREWPRSPDRHSSARGGAKICCASALPSKTPNSTKPVIGCANSKARPTFRRALEPGRHGAPVLSHEAHEDDSCTRLANPSRRQFWRDRVDDEQRKQVSQACRDKQRHVTMGDPDDVAGRQLKQDPADGSSHASDADDAGDSGLGEQVGGQSKEIGRPSLMPGGSKTHDGDHKPQVME